MRVAVALAMYNGEKYIAQQLLSLLNQHRKPDEVVLCDDCSSDRTVAIAERFIVDNELCSSWRVYRNRENLGYISNFHHAISLTDAEIVFLSDQDDVWDEKKIERMVEVFLNYPQISLLCCRYRVMNEEGIVQRGLLVSHSRNTGALNNVCVDNVLLRYRWPGMAMAFRRSFYSSLPVTIGQSTVPHDFLLALLGADQNVFWDFDYVGVSHRRHGDNVGREEHRVIRNLDISRKIRDIDTFTNMLRTVLESDFSLSDTARLSVRERLHVSQMRKEALCKRSVRMVASLYIRLRKMHFPLTTIVGDLLLALLGKMKR